MLSHQFIYGLLGACGVRRRRPPEVSAAELICGLVFHVVAGPGKLAAHVNKLTAINITDGALAQRRALLPPQVFEGMMSAALKPHADPENIISWRYDMVFGPDSKLVYYLTDP